MHLDAITPTMVHAALRALRTGTPLAASPLAGLTLVERAMDDHGFAHAEASRSHVLRAILCDMIVRQVVEQGHPGESSAVPAAPAGPADPSPGSASPNCIGEAAGSTDPQKEAWTVLELRYGASEGITLDQLAHTTGVPVRTLYRRLALGYRLLALELQRAELTATSAGH